MRMLEMRGFVPYVHQQLGQAANAVIVRFQR